MTLSRFEKALPWSGVVAGLCWIGQSFLFRIDQTDAPGNATSAFIHDNLALNYGAQACLVVMGVALLFFATSVRILLRSGESREALHSSIAYSGFLLMAAGLAQMVMWGWGLVNGAADVGDDAALKVLDYVAYFGFAGMGIGTATAFVATGLGGLRTAVLPRWFAITTLVLGVLSALGAAGIPPGGLVNYLLMPFWLIAAAIIVARRQGDLASRSALADVDRVRSAR